MDMNKSIDFVIEKGKQTFVHANIPRIRQLFRVDVQLGEVSRMADASQWVHVTGQNDASLTDAKTYITAITNPEKTVTVKNMQSCSQFNGNAREDVERKSCAFLSFEINGNLLVKGNEMSVALATSLLEELLKTEKKGKGFLTRKEIDDHFIPDIEQTEIKQIDSPAACASNVTSSQLSETSESTSRFLPLSSSDLNTSKISYAAAASIPLSCHQEQGVPSPEKSSQLQNCSKPLPVSLSHNGVNSSTFNFSAAGNGDSDRFRQQQCEYLRSVGFSSNYSSEDIEAGLASFDMGDVVKPRDFLDKLKECSKLRHGVIPKGGSPVRSSQPVPGNTSSTAAAQKRMDLDHSVIYLGSSPDAITISSDDEDVTVTEVQDKISVPSQEAPEKVALFSQTRVPVDIEYQPSNLRYIVIDGSNVAMAHGQNKVFSVKGIEISMEYFLSRGHQVMAFVPEWRRYSKNLSPIPTTNRNLLEKLNEEGFLKFTPARRLDDGKCIVSYDDRYILNLAVKENGIIVSNDHFRDLIAEKASYREVVEKRLLPFMFVNNHFMPPDDPLGRTGPSLEEFLRLPQKQIACVESARFNGNNRVRMPANNNQMGPRFQRQGPVFPHQNMGQRPQGHFAQAHPGQPVMAMPRMSGDHPRKSWQEQLPRPEMHDDCSGDRSLAVTQQLLEDLCQVFPELHQRKIVETILKNHPKEIDLNRLTNYCMSAIFT